VAGREHELLIFNTSVYLLGLGFADGALFGYESPSDLWEQEIPRGGRVVQLRWKDSWLDRPIMRAVDRDGACNVEPMTLHVFSMLLTKLLARAGYWGRITVHSMRRGLANQVESKYSAEERCQLLNHRSRAIFGDSYIANTSIVDGQSASLLEERQEAHIDYLRSSRRFQEEGLPTKLPAKQERIIDTDSTLEQMLHDLAALPEKDSVARRQAVAARGTYRGHLKALAFSKYRSDWIEARRDWRILTRGREDDALPLQNEIARLIARILPERSAVTVAILSMAPQPRNEKLQMIVNLTKLCSRDLRVVHYPGEEPVDGNCPVKRCSQRLQE